MLQAKEQADSGQTQGHNAGMSDDLQAEWRMRAGSALDDLRAQPTEHYDSLNIQVPASDVSVVCDSLLCIPAGWQIACCLCDIIGQAVMACYMSAVEAH